MPGPGCVCVYAMPPGGKSMRSQRAIQLVSLVEHDRVREQRSRRLGLARRELPGERVAVDLDGPEVRLTALDVERDRLGSGDLQPVAMLVQGQRPLPDAQWKYCPPSITMV